METIVKTHTGYGNVKRIESTPKGTNKSFTNSIVNFIYKLADAPAMTDKTVFESKDWPYLWRKK